MFSILTYLLRDWTGLIMLLDLFLFHFSLIFLFVACDELSWLHFSSLLHVKYTISYGIVLLTTYF